MTSLATRALPTASPPPPELAGTTAERMLVVVAPSNGRFQPALEAGAVAEGGVVGHIAGGSRRRESVRTPADVVVQGLLIRPGQLVMRGEALLWAMATKPCPA